MEYNKNTNKNVYSLSDSPFLDFTKIKELSSLLKKEITKKELKIEKPNLTKEEFIIGIEKYIKKSIDLFTPYFLSKNIYPDKSDIKILIDKLKKTI